MIRFIAPIIVLAAIAGCASEDPSASQVTPDQSTAPPSSQAASKPSPTESAPLVTASSSLEASPTSAPTPKQYTNGDIVAVTGDGLALRQGPGTAYILLAAARWSQDGVAVLDAPYRLTAGEQLVVGQGPLAIDGRDWYQVRHTDDEIQWTPPSDPKTGIQGWIAGNDGEEEFVRLVSEASQACCFAESGVGPATTANVPTLPVLTPGAVRGFRLTVGNADPAGSCEVRVVDDTDQVLVDATIVGWGNPNAWWPGEGDRLEIQTECSWSLSVGNFVG